MAGSVLTIGQAARDLLQQAIDTTGETATVLLGHPDTFVNDVTLYLYHHGYQPDVLKGGGNLRRPHEFAVHLMVRLTIDRQTSEARYLALHDAVTNAFYGSKEARQLNGAAQTSQMRPMSGAPSSAPYAMTTATGEFRQAWWMLECVDEWSFDWR